MTAFSEKNRKSDHMFEKRLYLNAYIIIARFMGESGETKWYDPGIVNRYVPKRV